MAVVRLLPAIVLALLLTSTAAASAASTAASSAAAVASVSRPVTDGRRDLASKLGLRRLLQEDSDCIPPMEMCCSNCFPGPDRTNCCDPNTVCSMNPFTDPGYLQDWCMPRNWDDLPKYAPWLFP